MKKRILVIFGGTSTEHEVSLKSSASIISMLDSEKYDVVKVGITTDGLWLKTNACPEQIQDGSWKSLPDNVRAILSPDREDAGLILKRDSGMELVKVDCVWPVLHGKYGEDGTIQGLFELAGLPYVGPGVCASAVSMDKSQTKIVVETSGVKQADYYLIRKLAYRKNADMEIAAVQAHFNQQFPLFVKPCSAGSSIGVTKVSCKEDLKGAIEEALLHDNKVLVEEAIIGREVEVAMIGNDVPRASVVGEVLSANEFYDYSAKYLNSASMTQIPADLREEDQIRIQEAAITVYSVLECKGLTRVDFFLTEDGTPVFNEVNTLPGFTNISMYPKLWEASGISNTELVDMLIELALEHQ